MIESMRYYAQRGYDGAVAVGAASVNITSELCKEVGGVRAIAGLISSVIRALELAGKPVSGLIKLAETCEVANKGLGIPHVFQRIHELTLARTYQSVNYLAARVSFLVKDVITFYKFLQDMALVSASTARGVFISSLAPTFEFNGWGLDASHNIADLYRAWQRDGAASLTFKRGTAIALDVTKLAAISFAGGTTNTLKALRLAALFGTSSVKMAQQIHKHVYPPQARA